jgi:hypothetical protein
MLHGLPPPSELALARQSRGRTRIARNAKHASWPLPTSHWPDPVWGVKAGVTGWAFGLGLKSLKFLNTHTWFTHSEMLGFDFALKANALPTATNTNVADKIILKFFIFPKLKVVITYAYNWLHSIGGRQ